MSPRIPTVTKANFRKLLNEHGQPSTDVLDQEEFDFLVEVEADGWKTLSDPTVKAAVEDCFERLQKSWQRQVDAEAELIADEEPAQEEPLPPGEHDQDDEDDEEEGPGPGSKAPKPTPKKPSGKAPVRKKTNAEKKTTEKPKTPKLAKKQKKKAPKKASQKPASVPATPVAEPKQKAQPKAKKTTAGKKPSAPKSTPAKSTSKPKAVAAKGKVIGKGQFAPGTAKRKVPIVRPAVRIVQRFLELTHKPQALSKYELLLRFVQEAILKKHVRKTSSFAEEVLSIQQTLVHIANTHEGNKPVNINLTNKQLARLTQIAGAERVYGSVALLRRFLRMMRIEPTQKVVQDLRMDAEAALADLSRISAQDPLRKAVQQMVKHLAKYEENMAKRPELDAYQLRGLEGLIDEPVNGLEGLDGHDDDLVGLEDDAVARVYGYTDGLGEIPKSGVGSKAMHPVQEQMPDVMPSTQLTTMHYDYIRVPKKYQKLFGARIGKGSQTTIHGIPGQGKSTLSVGLGREFALDNNRVAYISAEEYGRSSLQEVLARVGGGVPKFDIAGSIKAIDPGMYDVVFIDSLQKADLDSVEQLDELKNLYPKVTWFYVNQSTKDGKARGGQDALHEVDIVIKVEAGVAIAEKNRFDELHQMEIFKLK